MTDEDILSRILEEIEKAITHERHKDQKNNEDK